MNFPVHQPYKDGKGGVEIGLKPIPENSWLEIDDLFLNEIALKKKLFQERRQEVLITPSTSISIQKEVCLLYTSPSPRDKWQSRMPSSA